MIAKSATASGALSMPQTPAYSVLYLQTKPNEQIRSLIFSDKKRKIGFVKNGQNLSYLNGYFVMYPHKPTVKF